MTTQTKTPFELSQQEQEFSALIRFSLDEGLSYEGKLNLMATFAGATLPCEHHNLTTREMLKKIGVKLPANDIDVNMLEILLDMFDEHPEDVSTDPTHVLVVGKVFVADEGLTEVSSGRKIKVGDPVLKPLETYLNNLLKGKFLCNACITSSEIINPMIDA